MNPAGETAACPFTRIATEALDICQRTFQRPLPDGAVLRQFHRKTHACLRGEVHIDPPPHPGLRHGLFAQPGRYDAVVRFSSAFFPDDHVPDARGLAIKLRGVPGDVCEGAPPGQHDLVLANTPTALVATAAEALAQLRTLDGIDQVTPTRLLDARFLVNGPNPRHWRWRFLRAAVDVVAAFYRGGRLTGHTYYSQTPYRLGEGRMKMAVRPSRDLLRRAVRGESDRARLISALQQGSLTFDLLVQTGHTDREPVDDADRAWSTPLVKVGALLIPPQDLDRDLARGDHIAFSPWFCLRAHEPLGSLNRLRQLAYAASIAARNGNPYFPEDFTL